MASPLRHPAWRRLVERRSELTERGLPRIVAGDKARFERFSVNHDGLLFDFSHQELDEPALVDLVALAREAGVSEWRARLYAGENVNDTERLPAVHMALRTHREDVWHADGEPVTDLVLAERARCYRFARRVRESGHLGATGVPVTDIVTIGIGGTFTGPALLNDALHAYQDVPLRFHFVSNADGADLARVIEKCRPDTTLFIVVSTTFTTQEVLLNAESAKRWIAGELGDGAVAAHFVAVTAQAERAQRFGVDPELIFATWDWVGERFALWGGAGLAAMIAYGRRTFDELLDGAREIDRHFLDAPLESNVPVLMALVAVWNRNFCGAPAHCILPYAEALRMLPAHLVQLLTESLAKCVDRDGHPVEVATGCAVWGMQATDGQHALHQLLHQGTDAVNVDIIGFREPVEGGPDHHTVLLSNLVSQVESLLVGQVKEPGRQCAGGRSSVVIAFNRLDARNLGRLLALYEHQVFVQAVIWNLNPFDKWGVELGKHLAKPILEELRGGPRTPHDHATTGLLDYFTGS